MKCHNNKGKIFSLGKNQDAYQRLEGKGTGIRLIISETWWDGMGWDGWRIKDNGVIQPNF